MNPSSNKPFGTYALPLVLRFVLLLARHTLLGRGKARRLLWPILQRHQSDCYDVNVRDYQMRLFPEDNTVERKLMFRPDRYCPDEIAFLREVFADARPENPMFYLDVGANIGALSLPVATLKNVKVISVEPEPSAFQRLSFNLLANGFDQVIAENLALSDIDGEVDFISHTSDLKLSGINGRWSKGETIKVQATTLEGLLRKHKVGQIDVMKIDVEGHEDQILLPFFKSAPKALWPKHIIIEAIEREGLPDCIETMRHLGYRDGFQNRANLCLILTS